MDRHGLSERRACELAALHSSAFQYLKQDQGDELLRKRLRELRSLDALLRVKRRFVSD